MRARNHIIYGDEEKLRRLKEEYEYIGRVCKLEKDRLIVFALPPHKPKKKLNRRGKSEEHWSKRERNFGYTRG
jgi:hypothetical protein